MTPDEDEGREPAVRWDAERAAETARELLDAAREGSVDLVDEAGEVVLSVDTSRGPDMGDIDALGEPLAGLDDAALQALGDPWRR